MEWLPLRKPPYMAIDDSHVIDEKYPSAPQKEHYVRKSVFVSCAIFQIVVWLGTVAVLGFNRTRAIDPSLGEGIATGYYPAAVAVEYVEKFFKQDARYTTLKGTPTKETDKAWEDLKWPEDGLILASSKRGFDIDRLPPSSHSLTDPPLYVYGLEVHHNLHCLDRIRKSFHPQHYFPNDIEAHIIDHREHCIDHIRQALMCHGDISLDYWWWDEADWTNYLGTDRTPHMCRDYSKLQKWVDKYKFDKYEFWGPSGEMPPENRTKPINA